MMQWLRKRPETAAPDEVRAAREAAGWTHEQVAEAMGVLPLEVSAWESGAVTIDRYRADLLRWHIQMAEHEARLPHSDCYWMRANTARLDRLEERGPAGFRRAQREQAEHRDECAECMRVHLALASAPPPPQPPVQPGMLGNMLAAHRWIGRQPGWIRLPLRALEATLGWGVLYLLYEAMGLMDGDPFDPSFTGLGMLAAGTTWFIFLLNRLSGFADRYPYFAGWVIAAGVLLPATVVRGLLGAPTDGLAWFFAIIFSFIGGLVLGKSVEDERNDALGAADEERVVVIHQQDTSFRV